MSETQTQAADSPIWSRRTLAIGATTAALVVAGDFLFWPYEPGVNLALFGLAAVVSLLALNPERWRQRVVMIAATIALVSLLPAVEALTVTGFLWGLFGVSLLALAISGKLPCIYEQLPDTMIRFGLVSPFRLMADGFRLLGEAGGQAAGGKLLRGLLAWIVPAVFALIFVLLFTAANPVIEATLRSLRIEPLLQLLQPGRVVLWGVIAVMTWPLLSPKLLGWPTARMPAVPKVVPDGPIFGAAAIRNSLIVFNLLFTVQTAMDLLYLWGGVRLPEGMSYAAYAHRGAYPLIVTALLAAAFVLAAMRRGGAGEKSPLIRGLVYAWIGQNVLLVISSILRLDLYVEEYALTELRLAAGVWMGLVAVGLVLIVVRIALDRSNAWLVAMNLTVLGVVLYAMSVIDTRALIAWYNVEHSWEISGEGQRLDHYLMGDLGWTAMPALDWFLANATAGPDDPYKELRMMRETQAEFVLQPQPWQSWTWRQQRLVDYVRAHPFAPSP